MLEYCVMSFKSFIYRGWVLVLVKRQVSITLFIKLYILYYIGATRGRAVLPRSPCIFLFLGPTHKPHLPWDPTPVSFHFIKLNNNPLISTIIGLYLQIKDQFYILRAQLDVQRQAINNPKRAHHLKLHSGNY